MNARAGLVSGVLLVCIGCKPEQGAERESATSSPPAATVPNGRGDARMEPAGSPRPTEAEWNAAESVDLSGARALGCSAGVVRSHIRVSCSKTAAQKLPPTVVSTSSNRVVTTSNRDGVARIETPFESGLDLRATFVWGEEAHELVMRWPDAGPRPTSYGSFGPATAFDNPCKPLHLEGFGTYSSPCLVSGEVPITIAWTGKFGASASNEPIFEITNHTRKPIGSLLVSVAYFDAAKKPIARDAKGVEVSNTTYSVQLPAAIAAGAKLQRGLGPPKSDVPPTANDITATLQRFSWDPAEGPSVDFQVGPVASAGPRSSKSTKELEGQRLLR